MTQHEHHEHEHKGRHGGHPTHRRKPLHKNWITWVAVILMLAAMYTYIMTMDESLQPGNPVPGQPMPAAPAPVGP